MLRRRLLSSALLLVFISIGSVFANGQCSCPTPAFTSSLFGFDQTNMSAGITHNPSGLTYGKQRAWDSPCVWGLIEVTAGVYNFATQCDPFVNRAVSVNSKPIFVMGRTPKARINLPCLGTYQGSNTCAELPSDLGGVNTILPAYLTALNNYMTSSHPGVKYSIEGINEADLANECAEDGAGGGHCSAVRLVKYQQTLFNTIKAIDPTIQVLCPAASTFNHFGPHGYNGIDASSPPFIGNGWVNAGILTYCDTVNLHPYFSATTPEEAVNGAFTINGCTGNGGLAYVTCLLSTTGHAGFPVESSETNSGNASSGGSNTMSDALKMEWLGRYHIYAINEGHKNITWYEWECASGVLANCFGTMYFSGNILPWGTGLATIQDWFIGASGFSCSHPSTTWTCSLIVNTASGKQGAALIVFNNAGSTPSVSAGGHARAYRMDGTSTAIVANSYTVDGQPTLLF